MRKKILVYGLIAAILFTSVPLPVRAAGLPEAGTQEGMTADLDKPLETGTFDDMGDGWNSDSGTSLEEGSNLEDGNWDIEESDPKEDSNREDGKENIEESDPKEDPYSDGGEAGETVPFEDPTGDLDMEEASEGSITTSSSDILPLTIGSSTKVTLMNGNDMQWLSFTANQAGIYKFTAARNAESTSWNYPIMFLYGEPNANGDYLSLFRDSKSSGYCYCSMTAGQTVYISLKADDTTGGIYDVSAEEVKCQSLSHSAAGNTYTLTSADYKLELELQVRNHRIDVRGKFLENPKAGSYVTVRTEGGGYFKYNSEATIFMSKSEWYTCTVSDIDSNSNYKIIVEIADKDTRELCALSLDPSFTVKTMDGSKDAYFFSATSDYYQITVEQEVRYKALLRYRKKSDAAGSWICYPSEIFYYQNKAIEITEGLEPGTAYILQFVDPDRKDKIYAETEVSTKACPGTVVPKLEGNKLTVNVSGYKGSYSYFYTKASWVDAMGMKQEASRVGKLESGSASMEVELTDLPHGKASTYTVEAGEWESQMRYKSFEKTYTATYSTGFKIPGDGYITASVRPDPADGSRAEVSVALVDMDKIPNPEGVYTASIYYKMKAEPGYIANQKAKLDLYLTSYDGSAVLTGLQQGEDYEVSVVVDGVIKTLDFKTADVNASGITADISVTPMMQGISVSASLSPKESLKGTYRISAAVWNEEEKEWKSLLYEGNSWTTTELEEYAISNAIFRSEYIPYNVESQYRVVLYSNLSAEPRFTKTVTVKAAEFTMDLRIKEVGKNSVTFTAKTNQEKDKTVRESTVRLFYKENASSEWIEYATPVYYGGYQYEGERYTLTGLKKDTEYDLKLVAGDKTNSVLYQKEKAFRTDNETANISLAEAETGCDYMKVRWLYEPGEIKEGDYYRYVGLYYKEETEEEYQFIAAAFKSAGDLNGYKITDLKPDTVYDVRIELKSDYVKPIGENVMASDEIKVKTQPSDYELTMDKEDITPNRAKLTFRLKKGSGTLPTEVNLELTFRYRGLTEKESLTLDAASNWEKSMEFSGHDLQATVSAVLKEGSRVIAEFDNFAMFEMGDIIRAESIELLGGDRIMNVGDTVTIGASYKPDYPDTWIRWDWKPYNLLYMPSNGTFRAEKSGTVTVTAYSTDKENQRIAEDSVTITITSYSLKCRDENGEYANIPLMQYVGEECQLVVINNDIPSAEPGSGEPEPDREVKIKEWKLENPTGGTITKDGLFRSKDVGSVLVSAVTEDGVTIRRAFNVVNKVEGLYLSISTSDSIYKPIALDSCNEYTIAAGVDYTVTADFYPLETGSRKLSAPDDYVIEADEKYLKEGNILHVSPEEVKDGSITFTVRGHLTGSDNVCEMKLHVVRQAEDFTFEGTYLWTNVPSTIEAAGLPAGYEWENKDTIADSIVGKDSYSYMVKNQDQNVYPTDLKAKITFLTFREPLWKITTNTVDAGLAIKGGDVYAQVDELTMNESPQNLLWDRAGLAVKIDAGKYEEAEEVPGKGYRIPTPKAGTYTLMLSYNLYKAAWEDGNLTKGDLLGTYESTRTFICTEGVPVGGISFEYEGDDVLKEAGFERKNNTLTYVIGSDKAVKEDKAKTINVTVKVKDINGEEVKDAALKVTSSDRSFAKVTWDKKNPYNLTIKLKKGEGHAVILTEALDGSGTAGKIVIRVKNYAPRLTGTKKVTLDTNYGTQDYSPLANFRIPYQSDQWAGFYLIKDPKADYKSDDNRVKGIDLNLDEVGVITRYADVDANFTIAVRLNPNEAVEKTGKNLKYYLAVEAAKYEDVKYYPVKITILSGKPSVTVKQEKPCNLFYTDTTNETKTGVYGGTLGQLRIKAKGSGGNPIEIDRIVWRPGVEAEKAEDDPGQPDNMEFLIQRKKYGDNGNYYIDVNHPVLDQKKKASVNAAKGTLYIYCKGYHEPIKKNLSIKTVYKKPLVKIPGKFCFSPELKANRKELTVYSYAYKDATRMQKDGSKDNDLATYYKTILCKDEDVEVSVYNSGLTVSLYYYGTRSKNISLLLYSDYWNEPIEVKVRLKVNKPKIKPTATKFTFNVADNKKMTVSDRAYFRDVNSGGSKFFDVLSVTAKGEAKNILDQGYIKFNRGADSYGWSALAVTADCAAFREGKVKCGTYKYKVSASSKGVSLGTYTFTVKIVNQSPSVKLKKKGEINLLDTYVSGGVISSVEVTATFTGLETGATVKDVKIRGDYADDFTLTHLYLSDKVMIKPRDKSLLKAGREYKLELVYTFNNSNAIVSGWVTVKAVCKKPKLKVQNVILHISSNYAQEFLIEPGGYSKITEVVGGLDTNGDGINDLTVSEFEWYQGAPSRPSGTYRYQVNISGHSLDAVKPGTYKVPIQVTFQGTDGENGTFTYYVTVKVKK